MADPAPDMLLRLHSAANVVRAKHTDLQVRIRRRDAVEITRLKAAAVSRGHRFRDLVLGSPARHGAVLAGDLEPGAVTAALEAFGRAVLVEMASGPGRLRLAAEIARQGGAPS